MTRKKKAVSKQGDERNTIKSILDTTLIIGIVTGFLYLLSYFYDVGYKSHFNIPSSYSEISWRSILSMLGDNWIGVGITALFLTVLHYIATKYKKDAIKKLQWAWIFPFILLQIAPFIKLPVAAQSTLLVIVVSLVFTERNIAYNWHRTFIAFSIILSLAISCFYMQQIGIYKAATETEFEIIEKGNKDYVVLDSYKNYFIISPIDLVKNQIPDEYTFVSESEIAKESLKIENKNIGKITIRKQTKQLSN